jgi:hypothetical protein
MFRKMPLILLFLIIAVVLLDPFLSYTFKSVLYGISLSIKSLIVFLLPFIIFGLLFKVAANLARQATKVIFLILACVCLSNFCSTLVSYVVGSWVYQFDLPLVIPQSLKDLEPYWALSLPKLIPNDKAMFSGLTLGVFSSLLKPTWANQVSGYFEEVISKVLASLTFLIPLFVMGFVVKLQYDGVMTRIVEDYAFIFGIIAAAQFSYIAFLYLALNRFNIRTFLRCIQNMLPATIAGFSTMSSAAAMPLTIMGAEQNSENPDLVRSVIPATVNVHLMGDCFAIPIFAFAVLKNYGLAEPTFFTYLIFAFYFVLAKFSVAAVPGGGILVMLPILESHLGFNGDMMSLITALYILFDPVITSANVLGNGSFSLAIGKLSSGLRGLRPKTEEE